MMENYRPESKLILRLLLDKTHFALKKLRNFREPKIEDVFKLGRYYLGPEDFEITNYLRKHAWSAFNPGSVKINDTVYIFPRLIFDYYAYVSSVGVCSLNINGLVNGNIKKPLRTKVILWPREVWEQLGCEDPRVFAQNGMFYILYCGRGYYRIENGNVIKNDALALAVLDANWNVLKRGFFHVSKGEEKHVPSNRDSAFLKITGHTASLVTRPVVNGIKVCWRAVADIEEFTMNEKDLQPVFAPEKWESHIGWSTNAVELSSNEYLVGWHGVSKSDFAYRNGLALVDENGDLLAISNYVLSPSGLNEEYGDRPFTTFGNGLIVYKDLLIWIGGLSDCFVGIFVAELQKAIDKLRWITT